jgi:hypothetical protein
MISRFLLLILVLGALAAFSKRGFFGPVTPVTSAVSSVSMPLYL